MSGTAPSKNEGGVRLAKAIGLGVLASLFFASTFVLNRVMRLDGSSLWWISALRYFFTVPFLSLIVWRRGGLKTLWNEVVGHPGPWVLWGSIGFGLFYLPLTWVAGWAPAWLVASSWQLTIVAGSLWVPIIGGVDATERRIPMTSLTPSIVILIGVGVAEWSASHGSCLCVWWALVPILVAAFAYPLGNRQMMRYCRQHGGFDVYQRTLGMTFGSLPFWLVIAAVGAWRSGIPTGSETLDTLLVAVLSGVVATLLFFAATDSAQGRAEWLARIEATQSMEIVFTVLLASLLFGAVWPTPLGFVGLGLIVIGMVWHSGLYRQNNTVVGINSSL